MDSGKGFPYAIHADTLPARVPPPPPRQSSALIGEVYDVSEGVLALLDKLEGHPDWYRREYVEIAGETEPAFVYLLHDRELLEEVDKAPADFPTVEPHGDWRLYHKAQGEAAAVQVLETRRAAGWPSTRRTAQEGEGPHAVFSFGSNNIEQLRERCRNPNISGRPAVLDDACRVFAGASARWGGGGVASIIPMAGMQVHGNVC